MDTYRVPPSELASYRQTHRMLGPCCLCPMVDRNMPDFVESAIFLATVGHYAGEYVAACASKSGCGYMGEIECYL